MADTGDKEICLIGNSVVLPTNTYIGFGPTARFTVSAGQLTATGLSLTGLGFVTGTVPFTGATDYTFDGTIKPATNDGAALGTTALKFSDAFLASGAVLNFDNGNVVLTHSAGTWTLTTGALALGAHAVTINADAALISHRQRVTLAQMNAGQSLLTAVAGLKYRLVDIGVIAIGGSAAATAAATGIAIYGTQTGSVALYSALLAALAQSAFCQPGTANTSILADGASFVACDAATAITCKTTSAGAFDLITATNFDVILTYVLEA